MKKLLSVVLSLTILVCSLCAADVFALDAPLATANSGETNLIVNGGFEEELNEKGYVNGWGEGWRGIGDMLPERIKSEGHSGSFSASVSANYNCYIYTEFECEENTDYILTFWTKGAKNMACTVTPPFSPTGDQTMFAAGKQPENAIFKETLSDSTDWQLNTYSFNSGANTKLSVVFSTSWTGSASNLFDDIEVVKDAASKEALIKNGDFEDGTADWQWNNFGVTSDQVHGGTQALILNDGTMEYQNTFQVVSVKPNTDYMFSFWYYAPNGGDWWGGWFVNGLPEGTDPASYCRTRETTLAEGDYSVKGAWTQANALINSGDHDQLLIDFATHKITAYIDDVLLEEVKSPESEELIKNGGFEDGTADWRWNNFGVTSDQVHGGTQALILNDGTMEYQNTFQVVNVTPNTDYMFSFWYYAPNGGDWWGGWYVNGLPEGVDPSTYLRTRDTTLAEGDYSVKGAWTQATALINSGDHDQLLIDFATQKITAYIDDVSLTVYQQSEGLVQNSGFENDLIGWNAENNAFTVSDEAKDGEKSVNAKGGYHSRLSQLFVVEKQKNYKLSFWYKGNINASIINWGVATTLSFEEQFLLRKGVLTTAGDWTQVSVNFKSGDNDTLYIMFQSTSGCDYYIDSILIEETDEEAGDTVTGVQPIFGEIHQLTRYANSGGVNLVTDAGFESGSGNWSNLLADGVLSVSNEQAKNGEKSLKFAADNLDKDSVNAFYVPVEPNTDYIFSTWVYGTRRSDTNSTDMEFGVVDVNTGLFLPSSGNGNTDRVFTTEHQLSPLSWDNEWHLTGLTFNSGTATHIGIMIKGADSVAYFDDMYICKLSEAQVYVSPEDSKAEMTITDLEPSLLGCDSGDNLIENYDFSDAGSDFWQTGQVFGNQVTIKNTGGTKGNALHYAPVSKYPYRTYYIKYVNVEPNTSYTFSAKYNILKAGDGFFGIINGNRKLPTTTMQYVFDESRFDPDYKWQTVGFTFNSGGYDRIGIVVFDGGGEAYIDDMHLFKTSDAKTLTETDNFPKSMTSGIYDTSNGTLTGAAANTSLQSLLNGINESKYVRVFNGDTEITDKSVLAGTDFELRLMDGPEIKQRLRIIITGDINSDGRITVSDSDIILKYLTKQITLGSNVLKAADVDNNGTVNINDAVRIIAHNNNRVTIQPIK